MLRYAFNGGPNYMGLIDDDENGERFMFNTHSDAAYMWSDLRQGLNPFCPLFGDGLSPDDPAVYVICDDGDAVCVLTVSDVFKEVCYVNFK
jgi:hypothetical protein